MESTSGNSKRPSPSKAQRERLLLLNKDAIARLKSTRKAIHEVCSSDRWCSVVRTLGVDIGNTVRKKAAGNGLYAARIPGDDYCLLESTHQVVRRTLQDRDHPSFGLGCDLMVNQLTALNDLDKARRALGLPDRTKTFFNDYVRRVVFASRCYVFLLYTTYLRAQAPADARLLKRLDALLDRHRLFTILRDYPSGVSDVFLSFNGRHRFEEHNGPPFENRYHYFRDVGPNDTLTTLIQLYPNWDSTRDDRLRAIRQHNPALTEVDPDVRLLALSPPVKQVRMVPPQSQMDDYEVRIDQFQTLGRMADLESNRQPASIGTTGPENATLPTEANLDRKGKVLHWHDRPVPIARPLLFDLLACVVCHAPEFVPYETVLREVWDKEVVGKTVRVEVTRLNRVLRAAGITDFRVFSRNCCLAIGASPGEGKPTRSDR